MGDKGLLVVADAICPCCSNLVIGTMSYDVMDRFQVEYSLKLQEFSESIKLGTKTPYNSPIYNRSICPYCKRIVIGKIELDENYKNSYSLTLEEELDVEILEMAFKQKAPIERYWDQPDWQKAKKEKDREKQQELEKIKQWEDREQQVYELKGIQIRVDKQGVTPDIIFHTQVFDLERIPILIQLLHRIQKDHLSGELEDGNKDRSA